MGAVPKRRISKGRKNRRRGHDDLETLNLVPCQSCGKLKRPHRVCPNCGKYKQEEVVKTE